jgi:hypothetical protein
MYADIPIFNKDDNLDKLEDINIKLNECKTKFNDKKN